MGRSFVSHESSLFQGDERVNKELICQSRFFKPKPVCTPNVLQGLVELSLLQGLVELIFPPSLLQGLVELIVLNVGLQAGVLNEQLFSIFVIMALVTTFMTTPL